MAGNMTGMKGMGASKMKGRFPFKKKKKGVPQPAPKKGAEEAVEPRDLAAAESPVDEGAEVKKRKVSATY